MKMNDYNLDLYCADIAEDIWTEAKRQCDADATADDISDKAEDLVHEYCDGNEYTIYYYKAHELCQNCNTDFGEEFVNDIGATPTSYDDFATTLAYGEIVGRVRTALYKLTEEMENEEEAE